MRPWPRALLLTVFAALACSPLTRSLDEASATIPSTPGAPTQGAATPEPPAYVPQQCEGVPIATLPAPTVIPGPTAVLQTNPSLTPEGQLEVLRALTNAVRDRYVYPEAAGDEWLTRVRETQERIEAGLDTEAFYAEMQSLVGELGDEHSYFQTPSDIAEENISGSFGFVGIGALFDPSEDNTAATVLAVFDDGPASFAGIQPHDTLLSVDGGPVRDASGRSRTLGPECSAVVLGVRTPGQEPREMTLLRWAVSGYLPIYPTLIPTSDGSSIGYLFLPTLLDESLPDRVRQALEDFGPLDGLIIDNRMNGGGLGLVSERILGFFTSGHLGDFVSREGSEPLEIEADPVHNSQEVPLVVLVGEDTISYGEIISGILQDLGRARVVGQTTLGNVEQLARYDFEDGSRAWLATSRFEPANSDADWEATGIIPDVEVIAAWDTFTFETDPGIAAALSLLGHQQ